MASTNIEDSEAMVCCDPFKKHRKLVTKNLRKISQFDVLLNDQLVTGRYWCDNCRKLRNLSEALSSTPAQRDVDLKEGKEDTLPGGEVSAQKNVEGPVEDSISCCDPFKRHKSLITKNLRVITDCDASGSKELLAGSYWCNGCRIRILTNARNNQSGDAGSMGHKEAGAMEEPEQEDETETKPDTCCNPFNIHQKPVLKGLRVINELDKDGHPNLLVGLMWCDTCRKMKPDTSVDPTSEPSSQELGGVSQGSGSSGSPNLSPVIQKEAASRALKSLGLSPLVTSSLKSDGGKVSAAKSKVEDAVAVVSKKVSRALGVNVEDLQTIEAIKAHDHDLLMEEIKRKIPTASKVEKYQLLSLVPNSMTVLQAAQFFGVSRTLFSTARQLKQEQGILPIPDFSRASSVQESIKVLVVDFYCSGEYSKIMPGSRDCVSIKKGVYEQKRLLLGNLTELYQAFKEKNEGAKVGLSIFCSLKPKWCVSAGESGTHEQCICQTHQNFKLVTHALNIKAHYRDLIAMSVCNVEERACMLRLCERCPTVEDIKTVLQGQIKMPQIAGSDMLSSDDEYDYFDESVKFRQWKSTDRTEMIVQICTRSELLEKAAKQLSELIPHDFISCSQRDYLKKLKEDLPYNTVIVGMDFSMNYNCLIQGAVQSYHWSPKQATVHPAVIYYKTQENAVEHKSIIFISDDLEHDVPLVNKFQEETVGYIKENLPHIQEIIYSTDGCSSQYKSKGYFLLLCRHESLFGIKASHSYFATSHGKSQCDADGGSVKRKARKASLQRPLDNQIISAQDLFEFCVAEMSDKFHFRFVAKVEVDPIRNVYKESMATLETLPGTRTFHFIRPQNENVLACWRISNDQNEPPSLVHSLRKVTRKPTAEVSVSSGMYVVVRLARNRYVALVTDVYVNEAEADVSVLMPKLPAKEFKWPKEIKTATIPFPHILCSIHLEESNIGLAFTENDLEKLYSIRILKRPALD